MFYRFRVIALFLAFCLFSVLGFGADIKVLLVTGQNNHDWKASSPIFKETLEKSGLFDVEMLVTAPEGDLVDFKPDFSAYDVVVSDYNGGKWGAEAEKSFEEYMINGGGLVVIHAADNSFSQWVEYNKMIGLRWGGNEKNGPYIRWRGGKFIRDMTPGGAGGHGAQHAFQVIHRNMEHPITKGLPEKWMHAKDELYGSLRGPAENMTVLATSFADKSLGGSGEHEPVLFTINYGKGRVFHTVLGHVGGEYPPPPVQCAGFIVTLLRGTEWAATGKVTQQIPEDFPTADKYRLWANYKAPKLSELLAEIAGFEYGDNSAVFDDIAAIVTNAYGNAKLTSKFEDEFVKFLSANSTLAAKQAVCKQLSMIATEKSVPVLAKMSVDEDTCDMARFVLERISSSKVDGALQSVLADTKGSLKAGIINILAVRGDRSSAVVIGKLIYDHDETVASCAVSALGKLGGKDAIEVLGRAKRKLKGDMHKQVLDAYLSCASIFVEEGDGKQAFAIYKELYKPSSPHIIRIAALRGMVISSEESSGKIILDCLKDENPTVKAAAFGLVSEVSDVSQIKTIAGQLSRLDDSGKLQLLTALSEYGSKVALSDVLKETKSGSSQVKVAAYKAIGVIGDESTILLLTNAAASGSNAAEIKAARESLYRLRGRQIDRAILTYIPKTEGKVKAELINSVARRLIADSMDTLLQCAQDSDSVVVNASIKSMAIVARPDNIAPMVRLLSKLKSARQRQDIEKAMVAGLRKNADNENMDSELLVLFDSTSNTVARCSIINVLGRLGCDGSLGALRKSLKSDNEDEKEAAFRALVKWPNAEPMMDMLKIAKTDSKPVRQILAIRSYVQLVGRPSERSASENVELLKEAVAFTSRNEEKGMILDALAEYSCPEAIELAEGFLGGDLSSQAETLIAKLKMVTVSARPGDIAGITPKGNADGNFEVKKDDEGDGTLCWVFKDYFYHHIDNEFSKDTGGSVVVEVLFRDYGTGNLQLQYDSTDPSAPVDGAYKTAAKMVKLYDSSKWRTATWKIDDARFSNRQNAGCDMRFGAGGREIWLARIKVSKKP